MSALGHKRTFAVQKGMSALPPKADICGANRNVRFVPIADKVSDRQDAAAQWVSAVFSRSSTTRLKSDPMSCAWKPSSGTFAAWSCFRPTHRRTRAADLFLGVIDDAPHQQPAEPVPFEPRAYQDREFRGPFVELVLQAHEPEHLTRASSSAMKAISWR